MNVSGRLIYLKVKPDGILCGVKKLYTLTVRGNIVEVQAKLLNIKWLLRERREMGWKPFQSDETWIYRSAADVKVCPECKRFAARRTYNGTNIPMDFPLNEKFIGIRKRRPKVHRHKPWLKGVCRCTISWVDAIKTLETRLGKEMELVSEKLEMFP